MNFPSIASLDSLSIQPTSNIISPRTSRSNSTVAPGEEGDGPLIPTAGPNRADGWMPHQTPQEKHRQVQRLVQDQRRRMALSASPKPGEGDDPMIPTTGPNRADGWMPHQTPQEKHRQVQRLVQDQRRRMSHSASPQPQDHRESTAPIAFALGDWAANWQEHRPQGDRRGGLHAIGEVDAANLATLFMHYPFAKSMALRVWRTLLLLLTVDKNLAAKVRPPLFRVQQKRHSLSHLGMEGALGSLRHDALEAFFKDPFPPIENDVPSRLPTRRLTADNIMQLSIELASPVRAAPLSPFGDVNKSLASQNRKKFGAFMLWAVHNNQVDVMAALLEQLQGAEMDGDGWEEPTSPAMSNGMSPGHRSSFSGLCGFSAASPSHNPDTFSRHLLVVAARSNLQVMVRLLLSHAARHYSASSCRASPSPEARSVSEPASPRSQTSSQQQASSPLGKSSKQLLRRSKGRRISEAAVIFASRAGHLPVLEELVGSGPYADMTLLETAQEESGNGPMHVACLKGQSDVVKYFLSLLRGKSSEAEQEGGVSVAQIILNAEGHHGWAPLVIATEKGHVDIVRQLLDENVSNAPPVVDVNATGDSLHGTGDTALHRAVIHDRLEIMQVLLAHRADVTLTNENAQNRTALHVAVIKDRLDAAKLLLHSAAAKGSKSLLLEAKEDRDCTALHAAVSLDNADFVDFLLLAGAQWNSESKSEEGRMFTPLYLAVQGHHLAIVKMLLAHARSQEDTTTATTKKDTTMMDSLDKHQQPQNSQVDFNQILCVAAEHADIDIITVLVEAEAKQLEIEANKLSEGKKKKPTSSTRGNSYVKSAACPGSTPLHIAAAQGRLKVIEYLMLERSSTDLKALDSDGRTPQEVAAYNKRPEAGALIESLSKRKKKNSGQREAVDEACCALM